MARRLSLTAYGTGTAVRSLLTLALLSGIVITFVSSPLVRVLTGVCALTVAGLVLNFFRDPDRMVPQNGDVIIAPADGQIVQIKTQFEQSYLKQDALLVSIFMSPLNVHVNRFPISGTVEYFKHVPGKYFVAFHEKASDLNEHTLIGLSGNGSRVLMKQIAGALARRIVAPLSEGQPAVRGERFGMIKFGSRVDLYLPQDAVLRVNLSDRVTAGETVIASLS